MDEKKVKKKEEVQKEETAQNESGEDYKAKYLRALADYQNLERRVQGSSGVIAVSAESHLLFKLLPFLDNLEKAEVFVKDPGLKMVRDQFAQTLKQIGLEELEVVGKEYDPRFAEAIEVVAGDKNDMVVEVIQKGYQYKDKIVRIAKVKVSKKN